jgi:hypothetical protein
MVYCGLKLKPNPVSIGIDQDDCRIGPGIASDKGNLD